MYVHIAIFDCCFMLEFLQILCFHSRDFGTYKIVCDFASKTNKSRLQVPTRQHFIENLFLFGCEWKESSGNFGIDFQGLDLTHNILDYNPDSLDENTTATTTSTSSNKIRRIQMEENEDEES